MKNKKVLVTGGAGFIGSNLVGELFRSGNEVTVLDNFTTGYRRNLEPFSNVRIIEGDVRDKNVVEVAVRGNEVIFHLAASVGNKRSIDDPMGDAEINVLGTLNVLESARKYGVRKIITSSSAAIFGELKTIPIKEDHPAEPDTPYGCTKLCKEKLCLAYSKLYPLDVVCLRYFNVYGPNQRYDAYGNVIPIFVFRMLENKPLIVYGDGEQTRDFVHVDDVVQANILAADSDGVSGAFNIAGGKSNTINSLIRLITANQGIACKTEYTNKRPGDVLHSLADISLAAKTFGYAPSVTLEEGLKNYVAWARLEVAATRPPL
jgi:UDP-glucose 4-epimerase